MREIPQETPPGTPRPSSENHAAPDRARLAVADHALVQRALGGDPSAEEGLIGRLLCIGPILGGLNRRAGRLLREEQIDDLAQDVFRIVWERRADYEGDAALETWVYRFCQLTFLNHARGARRLRDRQEAAVTADVVEPARAALFSEDAHRVMAALHELPAADQRLVEQKLLNDRSFYGLSEEWGVSANTLKTRYYRAIDRMRGRLRRAFGEGAE